MRSWLLLAPVLAAGSCVGWFMLADRPPSDEELISHFRSHKAAFEQIRDMLAKDEQLLSVADWGVDTENSMLSTVPPIGLSVDRYHQYMGLLAKAGSTLAYRSREKDRECIGVWHDGFAGDTRHA